MPPHNSLVINAVDPYEALITPRPPLGLVGSIIFTIILIILAGWLGWFFVRWADRDLRAGKGPLFLYQRRIVHEVDYPGRNLPAGRRPRQ